MARKRIKLTDKKIEAMILEGRGQGEGDNYKPWITVQDLSSLGRCTETVGWKTGRLHNLLSKLETQYFLQLEWSDNVLDIREQYPLISGQKGYDETLEIARLIGLKHPIVPTTKIPNVMTTDFLITLSYEGKKILIARTLKYSKELSNLRTIEKFEIERLFWVKRNIDWKIVTEKQINQALVFNVEYVHKCKTLLGREHITYEIINEVEEYLRTNKLFQQATLADLTSESDYYFGIKEGSSLFIFRYLVANKIWEIDMNYKIRTDKPIKIKYINYGMYGEEQFK